MMRKRIALFDINEHYGYFLQSIQDYKNTYIDNPHIMMNRTTANLLSEKYKRETALSTNQCLSRESFAQDTYDIINECNIYIDNKLADGVVELC